MVAVFSSCNIDEETTILSPQIRVNGSSNYRVMVGDSIVIAPEYENAEDASFSWIIGNNKICTDRVFTYEAVVAEEVEIELVVTNISGKDSHIFNITSIDRFKVYDYTPAPGQFIGELKTAGFDGSETTMDDAIAYAERRMLNEQFVSLGAFGGYIVIGFDDCIKNHDGNDFAILGNSFDGSSEPGIVWVMEDVNGNGLPDDTWYELEGSESFSDDTIQLYEVTYHRPEAPATNVQWTDNQGDSGVIKYLASFHNQEYYYPQWIAENSYTLSGKLLKSKSYDQSENGSMWVNPAFDWGYADNASEDCIEGENHFDISNAVDTTGEPIIHDRINFIKIQSAIMQQCGWAGEISTEIRGLRVLDNE
jgi:hypothetical protein